MLMCTLSNICFVVILVGIPINGVPESVSIFFISVCLWTNLDYKVGIITCVDGISFGTFT